MAPKRRLSRGSGDLASKGQNFMRGAADQALQDAIDQLVASPEYAQPVLQFLETLRAPAPEAPPQDQLPASCNKFRLLSQAQLRDLLCKVSPMHADRIARVKGKHLALLLCFVINQDIASALYSKNKAVLEARVLQAAVRAGNRLNRVNWDSPDGVSWPMSGYFLIVLDDDQTPTHLQHVSGAQVPWPEAFAGMQGVAWRIEENYAFGEARVVGGMISVACTTIFSEAGTALQPPTFMPMVPELAGGVPRTPDAARGAGAFPASPAAGSSSSAASSWAASPAPVAPPPGHGGAA